MTPMTTAETAPAPTHEVARLSGASWWIKANRVAPGDKLVQPSKACGDNHFEVVSEPITTGHRQAFARVVERGGLHDGNEFGMHFSLGLS